MFFILLWGIAKPKQNTIHVTIAKIKPKILFFILLTPYNIFL